MRPLHFLAFAALALRVNAADFHLEANPKTVVIGNYSASTPPVLTVKSGDTVRIDTVSGSSGQFHRLGLTDSDIPPALLAIEHDVKERGPGGHILTGPVYIDDAEPGDTLEVHIDRIDLA